MKEHKKHKLTKIFSLIFLVLIAIGFTLPGFIDFSDQNTAVEPRVCQTDADCYLMCEEQPIAVLCAANLCQQNSCTEQSYYPYQAEPVKFDLKLIGLDNSLSNLTTSNNFYVQFDGQEVSVYTSGLSLDRILEKVNYNLAGKELQLTINGVESDYYGSYVPNAGDVIKIEIVKE